MSYDLVHGRSGEISTQTFKISKMKSKPKKKAYTTLLYPEMKEEADRRAESMGLSFSSWVGMAIGFFLKKK